MYNCWQRRRRCRCRQQWWQLHFLASNEINDPLNLADLFSLFLFFIRLFHYILFWKHVLRSNEKSGRRNRFYERHWQNKYEILIQKNVGFRIFFRIRCRRNWKIVLTNTKHTSNWIEANRIDWSFGEHYRTHVDVVEEIVEITRTKEKKTITTK